MAQPCLVFIRQFGIQRTSIDRCNQEFRKTPTGVVNRLAQLHGLTACMLGTQQSISVGIDHHLQRNAQYPAIIHDALMMAGNARRSCIQIQACGKIYHLLRFAMHLDPASRAQGPVAPANPGTRLQYGHLETGAFKLVCGDQSGNPRAKNRHMHACALLRGQGRQSMCGHRRQAQHLKPGGTGLEATQHHDSLQKLAAISAHPDAPVEEYGA